MTLCSRAAAKQVNCQCVGRRALERRVLRLCRDLAFVSCGRSLKAWPCLMRPRTLPLLLEVFLELVLRLKPWRSIPWALASADHADGGGAQDEGVDDEEPAEQKGREAEVEGEEQRARLGLCRRRWRVGRADCAAWIRSRVRETMLEMERDQVLPQMRLWEQACQMELEVALGREEMEALQREEQQRGIEVGAIHCRCGL